MDAGRRLFVVSLAAVTLAGCGKPPDFVALTPEKRARLSALRKAVKFNAENSALRNYPGPLDADSKAELNQIINTCLDAVLAQPNGRLDGDVVREQFVDALKKLDHFAPEDDDRAVDYLVEIWRVLGFKTKTGVLGEPDDDQGSIAKLKRLVQQVLGEIGGGGKK